MTLDKSLNSLFVAYRLWYRPWEKDALESTKWCRNVGQGLFPGIPLRNQVWWLKSQRVDPSRTGVLGASKCLSQFKRRLWQRKIHTAQQAMCLMSPQGRRQARQGLWHIAEMTQHSAPLPTHRAWEEQLEIQMRPSSWLRKQSQIFLTSAQKGYWGAALQGQRFWGQFKQSCLAPGNAGGWKTWLLGSFKHPCALDWPYARWPLGLLGKIGHPCSWLKKYSLVCSENLSKHSQKLQAFCK